MPERKLSDTVQVKIRMPEYLRRRIDVQATRRGRTMNDEIVRLLVKALDEDQDKLLSEMEGIVRENREQVVISLMDWLRRMTARDRKEMRLRELPESSSRSTAKPQDK